jgi:outer membrane protein assembly factor BamB
MGNAMEQRTKRGSCWTIGLAVVLFGNVCSGRLVADWTEWGGPSRDFSVSRLSADLKSAPTLVWKRELGPGESALLVDGSTLYAMYRDGDDEVIAALEAANGKTRWEHRYEAPIPEGLYVKHGDGPHAAPLIVGDRIFTLGIGGQLHGLDKKSGKPLWSRDLLKEFEGRSPDCGYGGSPLAHGKTVIVPVGGKGRGVVAFDQATGEVVWQSQDFGAGYATPILIDVDGDEQVVVFMRDVVAGLDPRTGELKWKHPHATEYGVNASTPVWGGDGILFVSSAYDNGSRGLAVSRDGDQTSVKELWHQKKMQIHFGNTIRIDDHIYGTSGSFGPAFLAALDVRTGEIAWQKRDVVAKGSMLRIERRLLILDEKGKLVAADVTPDGATVIAEHTLVDDRVWAPPTLVERRLYVRGRTHVFAFELASKSE